VRAEPSAAESTDEFWLTLKDPRASAGSLVQVCWINDDGEPAWRRFVMFRAGYRDVVARTKLPEPMEGGEFIEWPIETARLQAADAQLLLESFGEASQYDPAAVSDWRNWAIRMLQVPNLDPGLRPALQEIAESQAGEGSDHPGPSFAML